jgi:hypothetical protein
VTTSRMLQLLAVIAITPVMQASVTYEFQGFLNTHVVFTLPSFQQVTGELSSFDVNTSANGPIVSASLSGGSAGCIITSGLDTVTLPGPCVLVEYPNASFLGNSGSSAFAFTGPGTYTSASGTLTITDSAIPEPTTALLLGTALGLLLLRRTNACSSWRR